MKNLDFLWLLFSLILVAIGIYNGQNSLYQSIPILTLGTSVFIKPFTLILIGLTGIFAYAFYFIKERFSLNRVLKNFLIYILLTFMIVYFFEVIWHFFMAFSLFTLNNGSVSIDKIIRPEETMPDIFRAKLFLFEVLWAFFALMSVKSMKETSDGKLIFLKRQSNNYNS